MIIYRLKITNMIDDEFDSCDEIKTMFCLNVVLAAQFCRNGGDEGIEPDLGCEPNALPLSHAPCKREYYTTF